MLKISLATALKACNFIKKRLQHGRFPVSIPKRFRDNFFYRTTTVAAFELCLSIIFLTKKVSGKIVFDLISLFRKYKSLEEVQLPRENLPFLQNFFITKYLKQEEVNDKLSLCVDERSPCGLSMTEDIKIYQYHVIKK